MRLAAFAPAGLPLALAAAPGRLAIPEGDAAGPPAAAEISGIESFGPVGTSDDTATFNAWLRSGEPVRFGPQHYRVAGPLADTGAARVIGFGVPGRTVIERPAGLPAVNWVVLNARETWLAGITWDMGGQSAGIGWGVVLGRNVVRARLEHCTFRNNRALQQGSGLVVYGPARREDPFRLEIIDCEADHSSRASTIRR